MSLSASTYSMHLLTQTLPSRTRTRVSVAGLGFVPEWHPGNITWHFHLSYKSKDQPAGPCPVATSTFFQSFDSLSNVSHLARFQTWPLSHLHRALLHECSQVVRIQLWRRLDWDCHKGTAQREEQMQWRKRKEDYKASTYMYKHIQIFMLIRLKGQEWYAL